MDIPDSHDEQAPGHEGSDSADDDLAYFYKIFYDDHTPERRQEIPRLQLSQVANSVAQLSPRSRLSLSSTVRDTPPGSKSPKSPHIVIDMVPTPHDPQGMADDGAAWVTKLMVQMQAMSKLSQEEAQDLLEKVPSLTGAAAHAKQDTLDHAKDLRNRRIRTSLYSALLMYWLTFGLGKVAGNVYGAAMVASGMPAAALYAPLFTMLGVPFMQVIFGEPYGGAWRSAGVSYGSPDQAAYINYQTAHALYVRAWIEGNTSDQEEYRKVMNKIVDGLIDREHQRKQDGSPRIPPRLRSNASKPDRHDDGTVKPGHVDPSRAVVGAARLRSCITDEIPVHTFTVLNGLSGAANLFWKLGMSSALSRVPDMVAHTLMGSIAMISMFELQNSWRAKYQGVDLADGGHPAVLGAQKEVARLTFELWRERCNKALALIQKIDDMLQQLEVYRNHHSPEDKNWNDLLSYEATLVTAKGQLRKTLKDMLNAAHRAKKELATLSTRNARANVAAKRIMSSMVGESPTPEPWLDGAPMTIRSISRVLGYMTVLSTSTAQAILLGMSLVEYAQRQENAAALATAYNATLISDPVNDIGLTSDQMAIATLTASTVAFNAIIGWTCKTLYGLPLWEHGIHAVAGIATRAIQGARNSLGLAPDTTLPAQQDTDPANPVAPHDGPAYTRRDEHSSDIELPPLRSSSSSSSD